ncbi:DUF600 family protein [Bacillus carboniphilus]|uniref:DUF600 family protein n=1 Tax=Bacillus carboniphilus TaxID=86663 RepID=A0ABY9JT72_9BACI|nr:immunity protein YezG family protein [Bacillus carboniphilus]WLR42592.1 DUF600 family protein [Bacillus carboniphilus]
MGLEIALNKLYTEIAQQVNDIIPVEWDSFYFNGEVKEREGGVFFFFTPKGDEEYIFSHYIPKIYNMDKKTYNRELHKLFELTVELQKVFIENDQEPWFSVTIIVNKDRKLNVYFDYRNWRESEFGPADRISYFEYKYICKEKKKEDIELMLKMKEFEESQK